MTVCIDTNVLPGMFGRTTPLLPLRRGLLVRRFTWRSLRKSSWNTRKSPRERWVPQPWSG